MKKLFTFVLCLTALLILCTLTASAVTNTGEFYVEDAKKIDEILAGEAGEGDVAWEVPFLHIAPNLDGTIDKSEYLPFELYEDYLSWLANSSDPTTGTVPNTEEDFMTFYEGSQGDFVRPYWGWDGTYLYLAFEVNLINGFTCTPEAMGGDMYLWAYNCLQVGLSPADATGTNGYIELGYGVHSETNESLTFNWFGTYLPKPGEDFVGYYDKENQVLRYEMRIHLQTVLGLTDRTVENGDSMNMGWVLSTNGETTGPYDVWHLMFARGVSGPYSKDVSKLAMVTFTGKPDGLDIPVADIPGMSEEDKEYKLMEMIDFSDEAVVKTFEGENAAVDYMTEGDLSFMRITSLATDDDAYAFSTKYPRNIVGGQGDYVVIRYRTSSDKAEDLGLSYRSIFAPEYDLDMCYYDSVGTDGEWHTAIFYMTGEPGWDGNYFILNLCLVPFYGAKEFAQETFDVAWIKFYQNDPTELYEDDFFDPDVAAPETTAAVTDAATEAPVEDPTEAPVVETKAPAEDVTTTAQTPDEKGGCGSVVGFGVTAVLMAAAAAVALKKKES